MTKRNTKKTARTTAAKPTTTQVAVALIDSEGEVQFVPQNDVRFQRLAGAVASQYSIPHITGGGSDYPYTNTGVNPYQRLLGGSPNLRQLLLPPSNNFDQILNRIDYYRKYNSWINRALILRAAFDASELSIHAPNNHDQTEWMQTVARDLKFFSFAREWFWQLRAFGQVITLWKTDPEGDKPVSVECADLRAHQPRGPGLTPRLVVIPSKVETLKRLVEASRRSDQTGREAKARLQDYPEPLVEATRKSSGSREVEVDAQELAKYGYHLEYTAYDRRHYEDWAFPGIFTIFGDVEMVEMARSVDINALHHYKAAILLIRVGPQEPRGTDVPVMATDSHLLRIEKKIMEQARNKFPTLVTRGDFRMDFVTPPIEVFTPEKYKTAISNIFDWLGLPSVAWAGQELKGSFASAQTTLKFLSQESKDERDLFRETFERWFYDRAKASNAFKGAEWPLIAFDPNSLTEERIVLQKAQLLWQMGASEATVLDILGMNGAVEATMLRDFTEVKKALDVEFTPRPPQKTLGQPTGRPTTVDQPTPERETSPQPRPSNTR